MCYLIIRDSRKKGCFAYKTETGEKLVDYSDYLEDNFIKNNLDIELVTLSRPSAYGEYEPYNMVYSQDEFTQKVKDLCSLG